MNPSSNHTDKTSGLAVNIPQAGPMKDVLQTEQAENSPAKAVNGKSPVTIASIDKQAILDKLNLRLTSALQTSLDSQQVLEIFYRMIGSMVEIAGVEFKPALNGPTLSIGEKAWHTLSYQLDTGKTAVGEIIYYARKRLSGLTLETLENATSTIIYPMHNAARYSEAVSLAHEDALTGLGNRRGLESHLETVAARAQRHGHKASVILIDVDHFKKINDNHGHEIGDQVLQRIANILVSLSRDSDRVFRYGGEELVCILDNTDFEGAALVAERYVEQVAMMNFNDIFGDSDANGSESNTTISAGFTEISPEETNEAALKRADQAMYQSKNLGRNQAIGIKLTTH